LDIKKGIKLLVEDDFDAHSMWKYDDDTAVNYPITLLNEIPEYSRDLFIRAKFISPKGIILKGYLVGALNIYCIGIFSGGDEFLFNKNMPDRCMLAFEKLIKTLILKNPTLISDIFPLKYETTIDIEGFRNISGEFNAFEKLKDKRLLRWKKI